MLRKSPPARPSSLESAKSRSMMKSVRPLTFTLLRELSADHFTSGAALAEQHGLSRSAISDALKEAADLGVNVFSLTRRGYRLAAPLDFLDASAVTASLRSTAKRINLEIVDHIDSTNSALLQQAAAGTASGTCLVAELQTAGRGRRGRQWQSALGAALTFSLLWRFEKGVAALGGLSLVAGLAVASALRELGVAAELKWPNDIVMEGKKLGGILIETQGDMLGPTAAVIGIGLNVRLPDVLKNQIDQPVTDVADAITAAYVGQQQKFSPNRAELLGTVLRHLVAKLDIFAETGFAPMRDTWRALHAAEGAVIDVISSTEKYSAKVVDVGLDGSLIVERLIRNGERIALTAAEISIRLDRGGDR
jgi:BirA family transcriptional regulator, biotin operon repressor / biotin---[acetyl-CoA-carboxylase] ligase